MLATICNHFFSLLIFLLITDCQEPLCSVRGGPCLLELLLSLLYSILHEYMSFFFQNVMNIHWQGIVITPLKNATWPATPDRETQYSLFTVPGTEVLGQHLLRAVSRSDVFKF